MHYPIRRALLCCLIGLGCGGLALELSAAYSDWSAPIHFSWRGYALIAAYGGSIGAIFGFVVGIIARRSDPDARFSRILYAAVALTSGIAAMSCLPFTMPQEVSDLLTKPQLLVAPLRHFAAFAYFCSYFRCDFPQN